MVMARRNERCGRANLDLSLSVKMMKLYDCNIVLIVNQLHCTEKQAL